MPAVLIMAATLLAYGAPNVLPWLAQLEWHSLTARFRVRGPVAPGPDVVVVAIDNASIADVGGWPPPRDRLAELVDRLAADGAAVIAFDLLVSEHQGDVPPRLAAVLRDARNTLAGAEPDLAARIDGLLRASGPDRRLADAIEAAGTVLVPFAFVFDVAEANTVVVSRSVERAAYRVVHRPAGFGADPWPEPAGLLMPLRQLAPHAAGLGHVTAIVEGDGSLRYDYPVFGFAGHYYPSLPIEAVRLFRGLTKGAVAVRFGEGVLLGGRLVATDAAMRLIANYYGPRGTFESHPLHAVLDGDVPAGTFTGRIVVVGSTALAAGDRFATPFSQTLPGAEFHATVIDNILTDRLLARGPMAAVIDAVAIAGLSLAGLVFLTIPSLTARLVVLAAGVGLWWATVLVAFLDARLWLSFAYPALAIVAGFAWYGTVRAIRDQRSRREAERQRGNLARYLPPDLVDSLALSDEPFALDRTQHAAMLFVDIVGFTSMSERLAPSDAMALLRAFYARVEGHVGAHAGMLDKFLGDGALAVFGVGRPELADACRAADCAAALVADIAAWRGELEADGRPPVSVAVGLHYGPVLLGAVGGRHQFQVTVIGDAVNVASRLTELCRRHDTPIIASDTLVEAARAAGGGETVTAFVPLAEHAIRGRDRTIGLWAWRGAPGLGAPGLSAPGAVA